MRENCNVCNDGCVGATGAKCFRCGLPACLNCSSRQKYLTYGTQRICDSCDEELHPRGQADERD